jgi:2,4-dienoyl-CoA reductase-like NADH-dependent reductase (Old Yellow Enzyme family)
VFSPVAFRFMRGATDGDLARVRTEFADGARLVPDAGFDAIEVHLGHGYLLSAFLSPRLNRRRDGDGGGVENRSRFPRDVVRAVREAVGDRVAVTAKLNMDDGVRGGLRPDESVEVARLLESDGTLDALELTAGSSFQNPMYLFRGDAPVRELAAAMPRLLGVGTRIAGRRFLREYPFEEAFLLPTAKGIRAAVSMPLILLGGINRLETIHLAMREGFEFVAMGRALLMEPDLVGRMRSGAATEGTCIHCNKCMATIYSGTRCVLID